MEKETGRGVNKKSSKGSEYDQSTLYAWIEMSYEGSYYVQPNTC
jgi:hypothetical protein